jgi:glycine/serine hydroxymethyltransferase
MNLAHGGHLITEPGQHLRQVLQILAYGVDKTTERINYDEVRNNAARPSRS